MDTLGWIIVGVIVVLVIIGVVIFLGRKRKHEVAEQHREEDRHHASELRDKAQETDLEARDREAKASQAAAEAQRAEVDAERLRREAEQRQADAQGLRGETQDQARRADEIDPDVDTRPGQSTEATQAEHAGTRPDSATASEANPDHGAGPRHSETTHGETTHGETTHDDAARTDRDHNVDPDGSGPRR